MYKKVLIWKRNNTKQKSKIAIIWNKNNNFIDKKIKATLFITNLQK